MYVFQGHLSPFALLCNHHCILLQTLLIFIVHHWNHIPIKIQTLLPSPAPGNHHATFCLYEFIALCVCSVVKKICLQCRRPGFNTWVGKIPWRRTWHPTRIILPGRIPWTKEPGRLWSVGLQRAGHHGSDLAHKPAKAELEIWSWCFRFPWQCGLTWVLMCDVGSYMN